MLEKLEIAGGSITGRNHTVVGKNNQDAYFSISNDQFAIAVVCDGCGSGKDSEVGAKIGVRLVVEEVADQLQIQPQLNQEFWEQVKLNVLEQLQGIAKLLSGNCSEFISQIINDYLLFTIVGVVITPIETVTFSIGDGIVFVNGEVSYAGKFPDNAPPYLAYGLYHADLIDFHIHDRLPTGEVKSILIGTDGVADLIAAEFSHLPKKAECVGSISQFWQDDRYFSNPDQIRRRLSQVNYEFIKPNWSNRTLTKETGLLPDDTTLIVIRKKSS
ncbi:hypothetical protein Syn7502_02300 [Synechococcus sp. PCC 7502]|uniref:protein phosphatase 2C domain-containing protein n=1 Tax=Synechococcus sp. PCC 7502 TaxID=1173263 RepID=UPI00029F9435|nr:protein phosphatase 2C domain-containing protein [Synechococcus sp. PCC 7502]AFY74303.1 hypothetical protein Syn7502_02300 [Synechococcus sp. PCC 7502]